MDTEANEVGRSAQGPVKHVRKDWKHDAIYFKAEAEKWQRLFFAALALAAVLGIAAIQFAVKLGVGR